MINEIITVCRARKKAGERSNTKRNEINGSQNALLYWLRIVHLLFFRKNGRERKGSDSKGFFFLLLLCCLKALFISFRNRNAY